MTTRTSLRPAVYDSLERVLDEALDQAQRGKGTARNAAPGESSRLPTGHPHAELLGAIDHLAASVLVLDRRQGIRRCPAL